ncbi:hypothetical protein LXL04_037791 [Taraxacum kok-saghyz]
MMEIQTEAPAKKPKRLTSVVWNHFERVRKADACYAVCVHCQKKLSGSSNSGTTHLRNHLMRCLKRSNFDVSQILAAKRKRKDDTITVANYDEALQRKEEINNNNIALPISYKFDQESKIEDPVNLGSIKFDQERSRFDLARMIMLHDYPPAMVEHIGFKIFVKNLQPMFDVTSTSVIESDCLSIYSKERQKVSETLRNLPGRISLSAGTWWSPENTEYVSLTANFIDDQWKLNKKILNFLTLDPSQTDDSLSDLIIKCLIDWDVDRKIFSLTLDDFSSHNNMKESVLKYGELFDIRCALHLVKSLMKDAMESLIPITEKIRESIRYVKSTSSTQEKFNELSHLVKSLMKDGMESLIPITEKIRESIRHVKSTSSTQEKFNELSQQSVNTTKCLFLDNPVRWNSTYLMLESAVENRGAFYLLQQHNDENHLFFLSDEEWTRVGSVTSFMKLLIEVTNVFSHSKNPTANIFFPEICDVHIQLLDYAKSPDDFVRTLVEKMKTKFDKYLATCGPALAIATILDPRFKMKLVEYYYKQIYDSEAPEKIREVSDNVRELFNDYSSESEPGPGDGELTQSNGLESGVRDRLRGFDKFLNESGNSQSGVSDLEKYLEEPVFPRNHDFNILNWWKVHTPRYPILSMMARDILGIPLSTLTPELAFRSGGRVVDERLRAVDPDVRQALICGQDWLRMDPQETITNTSSLPIVPLAVELP